MRRQLTGGRRRPVSSRQHIDTARPHPSIAMFDVEGCSPDRPNVLPKAFGIVRGSVSQHAEVRCKHRRLGAAEFEALYITALARPRLQRLCTRRDVVAEDIYELHFRTEKLVHAPRIVVLPGTNHQLLASQQALRIGITKRRTVGPQRTRSRPDRLHRIDNRRLRTKSGPPLLAFTHENRRRVIRWHQRLSLADAVHIGAVRKHRRMRRQFSHLNVCQAITVDVALAPAQDRYSRSVVEPSGRTPTHEFIGKKRFPKFRVA